MQLLKTIRQLEYIDSLIRKGGTGSPEQLAKKNEFIYATSLSLNRGFKGFWFSNSLFFQRSKICL